MQISQLPATHRQQPTREYLRPVPPSRPQTRRKQRPMRQARWRLPPAR